MAAGVGFAVAMRAITDRFGNYRVLFQTRREYIHAGSGAAFVAAHPAPLESPAVTSL